MALREIMERNKLSQADVARGCHVTTQSVWMWVHGQAKPGTESLLALVEYLQAIDPSVTARDIVPTERVA